MLKKFLAFFATKKRDPRELETLDGFLKEEGIHDEVTTASRARVARIHNAIKDEQSRTRARRTAASSSLGASYGRRREMEEVAEPDPYLPIAVMAMAQDTSAPNPAPEERYTPDYGTPSHSSYGSSDSSYGSCSSSDNGSSSSYDSGSSSSDCGSSGGSFD